MKDLDFDELDQAVSSVLGANEDPKKETPAETTDAPAVKPDDVAKPAEKADKKDETPAVPSVTPAISPAVRRRGQFLDMVHPSADMTSRLPVTSPAARKQLAPVSADVSSLKPDAKPAEIAKVEEEPTTAPKPEQPAVEAEAPETPTSEAAIEEPTKSADDVKWPDPLDVDTSMESKTDEPTDDKPEEAVPDEKPADEPAATPFVPDVKVDKRPLGGLAAQPGEETASDPVKPLETPTMPTPSDATASTPVPTEESKMPESTPPELQPDVVSVEAAANREFAPDGKDTETDEDANKGIAQSIPQQYHAPAEKPDNATHPVFDTDEYHQPLLPAHSKKKRGWLVVVIILGLLLVGAALGYFAFMAGL